MEQWAKTDVNYQDFSGLIVPSSVMLNAQGQVIGNNMEYADVNPELRAELEARFYKVGIIDSFMGTITESLSFTNEQSILTLIEQIDSAYTNIQSAIYQGFYSNVLFTKYSEQVQIKMVGNDLSDVRVEVDISQLTILLKSRTDVSSAVIDAVEYFYHLSETVGDFLIKGSEDLFSWINQTLDSLEGDLRLDIINTINSNDVVDDSVIGSEKVDVIYGNFVFGEAGGDTIYANANTSFLSGGAGNDTLIGNKGDDVLIGGTGDDALDGGAGNDTYIFSKGHGKDSISDYGVGVDTIRFTDVNSTEVRLGFNRGELVIEGYNEGDSVSIANFQSGTNYAIEHFVFADRAFTLNELLAHYQVSGTESGDNISLPSHLNGDLSFDLKGGADSFNSTNISSNVTVDAGDGDDYVLTGSGNDTLIGGAGNDSLYGGAGNDTLIGGVGRDILHGGSGADTFVFDLINIDGNIDEIRDFNVSDGDLIDVSSLLDGANQDSLADFLEVTNTGGSVTIGLKDGNGVGTDFLVLSNWNSANNLDDLIAMNALII